jgi:hypothetical protein
MSSRFSIHISIHTVSRVAAIVCAVASAVSAEEPTAAQVRFFETSIRPVLVERCLKCHGTEKQWGSLRLDSREAMLKGGDTGPSVVPGQPDESLLIRAIRHLDDELKMPPKEPLSDRQIADFVSWVKQGAAYPQAADPAKSRHRDPKHWAFQPPTDPPVPAVQDAAWPDSALDQFILAKLEAAGIRPAGIADKRTLIRRATFDLTGLPPTVTEIADFLGDDRPDAFARLVDRLLASPAYGERWGRHWLDVARYADSNGLDENVAHGNAWRYRDYVVASLNEDKPYDRFVVEQLAGDLLPAKSDADRNELLIATGFLAIGPKVLAEVDETKMQMDIIDEQIDTVGRTFLGMTFGCARCHDHKFDPIDTADYYGLAGIFKSTRTMENFKKVAKWHENPIPTAESLARTTAFHEQLAQKKGALQAAIERADAQARAAVPQGEPPPQKLETLYSDESKAGIKQLRDDVAQFEKSAPETPSAMGVNEDAVVDVAVHVRGNPLKLGDIVPRRVPNVLAGTAPPQFDAKHSGRLEMASSFTAPTHPLTSRVLVNRVWRWHFGHGLVRTPDNFGLLGEAPTHPGLLDWLARRFMADGWSLKQLHRRVMLSRTYQLGSDVGADLIERDPENRLFGRAEIRRLEAEAIRDALIAISGRLDRTMGGSLLTVKNRAYFFDHTSKDLTNYNSRRRSLYLPVVRNNVYDVFQLLDFPDAAVPTGDRPTTTVAPQALMMMNSELIMQASSDLAEMLLAEPSRDDRARIRLLFASAYGREATDKELDESQSFLAAVASELNEADAGRRRQISWSSLCQVVLAANEFVYLK